MAALQLLWGRIAPYALGAVALVAALLTFGASQRRAGRDAARVESLTNTVESLHEQDKAAAAAPRGRAAVAQRMRDGGF